MPQDTYDALTAQFTPGQGWNTTQAKTEISRFLAANLTLREGTVTPATGDVAAWLLTGARQGYSVHYATLTTLLLSCCGIPARYVEGYVVTRQQAEALSDGAQLTLTSGPPMPGGVLSGRRGLVPFDTVPGYGRTSSTNCRRTAIRRKTRTARPTRGRIKRPNRTRPTSLRSLRTTTVSAFSSRVYCWPWRHWCGCVWQPWRCGRCCCGGS
ncbi:MAG: transglutaminase-like domain-containing protein [Oscillospiraceae bacterium]